MSFSGCLGEKSEDKGVKSIGPRIVSERHYDEWEGIKNVTVIEKEVSVGEETYSWATVRFEWDGEMHGTDFAKVSERLATELQIVPVKEPYEDAFNWIKENTPKEAVILCWWDYGNMIRLFTKRETVIGEPCDTEKCLGTISDKGAGLTLFEPVEKVEDVARFFTSSEEEAYPIAQKYGADYVMVTVEELGKSDAIAHIAEVPSFILKTDEGWEHSPETKNVLLVQMLFYNGQDLESFKQIYTNSYLSIYEVSK